MENFLQKAELKACLKPIFLKPDCLLQFYGFLAKALNDVRMVSKFA